MNLFGYFSKQSTLIVCHNKVDVTSITQNEFVTDAVKTLNCGCDCTVSIIEKTMRMC